MLYLYLLFIVFCINNLKLDSKWEYCSPLLWMNVLGLFCYWLVRLKTYNLSSKSTTLWFAKISISMKIPNSGCSVRKMDWYFCQESYWLGSHSCRVLLCTHHALWAEISWNLRKFTALFIFLLFFPPSFINCVLLWKILFICVFFLAYPSLSCINFLIVLLDGMQHSAIWN